MTIDVATPDGGVAHFPDGTPPDVMRNALRAKFGGGPAKTISGEMAVKSGFETMVGNIPKSAANLAKGVVSTAAGAAGALVNPDPRAKVEFIKNIAVGTYEGLKERYGSGFRHAIESDPVGVITDVLSVASGLRAGVRGGVRGEAVSAPSELPLTPAAERARTELAGKFAKDQTTPAQLEEATKGGLTKPIDVGGSQIMGTVERLSNTSMAGRETMEPFLTERQTGQLDRITSDLKTLTGSARTARQAVEQTIKAQESSAAPLYKAAYDAGDKIIWSDEMERLTGVPEVQEAMQSAATGWQRSQIAQGYGSAKPGAIVGNGGIIKMIKGRVPVFPNIQFWDYTKRALDNIIDGEIKPDGRMTNRGRELVQIKNKLVGELDKQVGEYGAARQAWAGPASYLNAIKTGRNIFAESAEDMAAEFKNLPEADKQGYREAAVSSILSKLGSNPTKLADLTRYLRSPEMRAKITELMPTQEAKDAWTKRLNFEVKSSELVGAGLKNSATARRVAQMMDAESLTGDLVLGIAKAATGSVRSEAFKAIVFGAKKIKDRLRADIDRQMANILTGKGGSRAPKPINPTLSLGQSSLLALPAADIGGLQQ